jgi:hypothetical protein
MTPAPSTAPAAPATRAPDLLRMLKVAVSDARHRWVSDVVRETEAGRDGRALQDWVPEAEALIAELRECS